MRYCGYKGDRKRLRRSARQSKGYDLIPLWLHFPIVLALALASWISAIDTTGDPGDAMLLWTATAFAGVLLALRLLVRPSRA